MGIPNRTSYTLDNSCLKKMIKGDFQQGALKKTSLSQSLRGTTSRHKKVAVVLGTASDGHTTCGRRVVLGDQIALEACKSGRFSGIVVLGSARDSAVLIQNSNSLISSNFGIKASEGCHPRKTDKNDKRTIGEALMLPGGGLVEPDDFVVADEDGVMIVPKKYILRRQREKKKSSGNCSGKL